MLKIIFHVDEVNRWELTLRNVQNLLSSGESLEIEVLANAAAVRLFTLPDQSGTLQDIAKLAQSGVVFAACKHALAAYQITQERLPPFVTVVPVGVLELARRQTEGYAYIKP
ncbi:MAG TPA: DsrE family protein [Candidatus Limiplasma sp.]|jgi:intracellular sulfur oxidation DsrE/DsrF family protein|nr:DsrE family protein [Candidatus Limiplasma sp.]HPR77710.1 DsrE family protein [Candidatus Limiplasma sp.]